MPWWGELIYAIGQCITLFPIAIGLYRIKHLNSSTLAVFFWMCSMLCIQVYSTLQYNAGLVNLPSYHLMVFLNALFASYFFINILSNKILKLTVILSGFILLVFLAINPFVFISMEKSNGLSMAIESYVFMVWCFMYLMELLKREKVIQLFDSAPFFIVIGLLLYFGTAQFIQLLQWYVSRHIKELVHLFRYIDNSIMIVYYFIIGIGLWKTKLQKT